MKPTSEHSFPDAKVDLWQLSGSILEIEISEVHFQGHSHGPARIVFPLLGPLISMSYDHETNQWTEEIEVEPLKDICEFHFKALKHYSIKGFGAKSGRWSAVSIKSENAEIQYKN